MLILWTLFYKNIEIDFVETQLLMWLKAAWQCVMRYSGCWCVCSESAGWRWQHGRRRQTHYWYPWSRQCASVSQHTAAGDGRRCLHWRLSSRSMLCCHWEMFCLSVDSLLYVVWLTDLLLFTASQTWDDLFDWLCRKWLSESFHSDLRTQQSLTCDRLVNSLTGRLSDQLLLHVFAAVCQSSCLDLCWRLDEHRKFLILKIPRLICKCFSFDRIWFALVERVM